MSTWEERLGCALRALEKARFPRKAICHHLGVSVPGTSEPGITLAPRGSWLLVMVYHRTGRALDEGLSGETLSGYVDAVRKHGKVIETWNGAPGHLGVSVVIQRKAPAGFVRAIRNYHALPNVFDLRPQDRRGFEALDRAWEKALAAEGLADG